MTDIDQLYYDKNYYIVPEPGGEKAFELLRQALLSQKKVAIAKTVMGTKEELIVLYPTKTDKFNQLQLLTRFLLIKMNLKWLKP